MGLLSNITGARDKAVSEAANGDGTRAIAWAIIYLADQVGKSKRTPANPN